jgi:hypothetical protein
VDSLHLVRPGTAASEAPLTICRCDVCRGRTVEAIPTVEHYRLIVPLSEDATDVEELTR